MKNQFLFNRTLLLLGFGLLAGFAGRTALAARGNAPRLDDLFTATTLVGSLVVWLTGYHSLHKSDWVVALSVGAVVAGGMVFATLFSPYPFFGIAGSNLGQALVRGLSSTLAMFGGLVIMRRGGPVQVCTAMGEWRELGSSLALGLAAGAPLALLNVFALRLTQGHSVNWQNPLAAFLDALQPGIVEEVIYRFAFLGLLWLALRKPLPDQAAWISGLLAMLVHNFIHFDDLLLQSPLAALGMGSVIAVVWGLPLTYLALRRGLESSIAFHWVQDAARFLAGF